MSFTEEVGIDLGTANVLIYVDGKGIALQEPSVVAVNKRYKKEILAIGSEAKRMIGRTPGNIAAIRPLREGVISDYDITERMLQYFYSRGTCGGGSRIFAEAHRMCSKWRDRSGKACSQGGSTAGRRLVGISH